MTLTNLSEILRSYRVSMRLQVVCRGTGDVLMVRFEAEKAEPNEPVTTTDWVGTIHDDLETPAALNSLMERARTYRRHHDTRTA